MFSIKKCGDVDCVCGPIRPHQSVFENLHHLPDPRPSPSNPEKYISFSESYGRPTTDTPDKHLPSPRVQNKEHGIPFSPSAQSAKNTKLVIKCEGCGKWRWRWRCIYSKRKLKVDEKQVAMISLETLRYMCGASINAVSSEDGESSHMDKLYTSLKLSCNTPIEIPYFRTFPNEPLCFHCRAEDGIVGHDNNN